MIVLSHTHVHWLWMQYKKLVTDIPAQQCHWRPLLTISFNAIYDMTQAIPPGWDVIDLSFRADIPL
jgi:hypothetical protein